MQGHTKKVNSRRQAGGLNSIRDALRRQPFQPFAMCLADGRRVEVRHPEYVAMNKRIVVVVDDDSFTMTIEPLLIVSLEQLKQPPKSANGSHKKSGATLSTL